MKIGVSKMTWIEKTNQKWKVILFCFLMFLVLSVFSVFVWRINSRSEVPSYGWMPSEEMLAFTFVGLGAVAFAGLWFSIRCPRCNTTVAAELLKRNDISSWFTTLITLEKCPHCGDP